MALSKSSSYIDEEYKKAVSILLKVPYIHNELPDKERALLVFPMMPKLLERVGIKVSDLDSLNAIHVAGTKGKGSVCAMCESILRAQGLKTGFFNSPHLLEVRERIRINGVPLSKELFVKYFKECYNSLTADKTQPMPAFFRFSLAMAFKIFITEKVDVAIIEVGLGGRYDATNVIQKPKVCGITCLDYDHVDVLGDTISDIAWHKAGICKPDVPIYTSVQSPEALEMIRSCSKETNVASVAVAPYPSVYPDSTYWSIGIAGDRQLENASLSVQLCRRWLKEMGMWEQEEEKTVDESAPVSIIPYASVFPLPQSFIKGLKDCYWPGRCQIIKRVGVSYYFDVSHTVKSLQCSAGWFDEVATQEASSIKGKSIVRMLLFNFKGCRDAKNLLPEIAFLGFDHAIFCPNVISTNAPPNPDQSEQRPEPLKLMLDRCSENEKLWCALPKPKSCDTHVFDSISDAIKWVETMKDPQINRLQVMVCGSLRLVGSTMTVLGYTVKN